MLATEDDLQIPHKIGDMSTGRLEITLTRVAYTWRRPAWRRLPDVWHAVRQAWQLLRPEGWALPQVLGACVLVGVATLCCDVNAITVNAAPHVDPKPDDDNAPPAPAVAVDRPVRTLMREPALVH